MSVDDIGITYSNINGRQARSMANDVSAHTTHTIDAKHHHPKSLA